MNFTAKCLVSVAILIARALTTSSVLAGSPHGGKGNSMGRSMSRSTATGSMNHGGFAKSGQPSSGKSSSSSHSLGSSSFKKLPQGSAQQAMSHGTAGSPSGLSKYKSTNSAGSLSTKLKPQSDSSQGKGQLGSHFDKAKLSLANNPGFTPKNGQPGNGNKPHGNGGNDKHDHHDKQQHCHNHPWPKPPVCHNWPSYCGPGFGFGVGYCAPYTICAPYSNGPQVVTEVIVVETQPVIVPASAEAAPANAAAAVVPAAAELDKKLPSVPAAATLTISGAGFGKDTGEVVLQVAELTMTVEVITWENEKVTITVPRLGVVAPTKAELHLLTATGELAQSVPFELVAAK